MVMMVILVSAADTISSDRINLEIRTGSDTYPVGVSIPVDVYMSHPVSKQVLDTKIFVSMPAGTTVVPISGTLGTFFTPDDYARAGNKNTQYSTQTNVWQFYTGAGVQNPVIDKTTPTKVFSFTMSTATEGPLEIKFDTKTKVMQSANAAEGTYVYYTNQTTSKTLTITGASFSCTGTLPAATQAQLCTGDDAGLSAAASYGKVDSAATCTAAKCEYYCVGGYSGANCATPPTFSCTGTLPAATQAQLCTGDDTGLGAAASYGKVDSAATCTAAKCEYYCVGGYSGAACGTLDRKAQLKAALNAKIDEADTPLPDSANDNQADRNSFLILISKLANTIKAFFS